MKSTFILFMFDDNIYVSTFNNLEEQLHNISRTSNWILVVNIYSKLTKVMCHLFDFQKVQAAVLHMGAAILEKPHHID